MISVCIPAHNRANAYPELLAREEPVIRTAGMFFLRKNHAVLVKVMGPWASEGRPENTLIVGHGSERPTLWENTQCRRFDNRILLWDYLAQADYIDLLDVSTAFLFPASMEGFEVAAVEVSVCGTLAMAPSQRVLPQGTRKGREGFALPIYNGPRTCANRLHLRSRCASVLDL